MQVVVGLLLWCKLLRLRLWLRVKEVIVLLWHVAEQTELTAGVSAAAVHDPADS